MSINGCRLLPANLADKMRAFKKNFMHILRNRVKEIGQTALVLDKWDRVMETLGQIWVIWEVFSTTDGEAQLDVLLSHDQEKRMVDKMFNGGGTEMV